MEFLRPFLLRVVWGVDIDASLATTIDENGRYRVGSKRCWKGYSSSGTGAHVVDWDVGMGRGERLGGRVVHI